MKIKDILQKDYQCLIDGNAGVVRIWAKLPKDGRTLRAIQKRFPHMEDRDSFFRLGGYHSVSEALEALAEAKLNSEVCGRLHAVMIHESAL